MLSNIYTIKDKQAMGLSYVYNQNSYAGKTESKYMYVVTVSKTLVRFI